MLSSYGNRLILEERYFDKCNKSEALKHLTDASSRQNSNTCLVAAR